MFVDTFVLGAIYLIAAFALFVLGKVVFDLTHRSFTLRQELVERDNLALGITFAGYLIGLTLALGGALGGTSTTLLADLRDILLYGVIAIVLLNLSMWVNDWIILRRFSAEKEIVQDRNCGVGMIAAANHVAMGLILFGIISGEGGGVLGVVVFWILGQLALIAGAWVYNWITPYDLHRALEANNAAVGTAFAGMLLAIGNIVRFAEQGQFVSWAHSMGAFAAVVLFGLVALPVIRFATDKLILPGGRLTHELVSQEHPNIGAGVIEAALYVSMSFLIGWCIA